MNIMRTIAVIFLLLGSIAQGMQQTYLGRLPQAVQDDIQARLFIDELSKKARYPDKETTFSNIISFFTLYPHFAKDKPFVDYILNIIDAKFLENDVTTLANLLKEKGIQPAAHWRINYELSKAIQRREKEKVEALVKQGATINERFQGKMPLAEAAQALPRLGVIQPNPERIQIVEYLLLQGADVNSVDELNRSALIHAAAIPNAAGVKLLLKHKANPNQKDSLGRTALDWAIYSAREAENFYSHDLPEVTEAIKEAINALLESGANINSRDNANKTVLDRAGELLREAQKGHKQNMIIVLKPLIEFLKSKGAQSAASAVKVSKL